MSIHDIYNIKNTFKKITDRDQKVVKDSPNKTQNKLNEAAKRYKSPVYQKSNFAVGLLSLQSLSQNNPHDRKPLKNAVTLLNKA